MTTTQLSFWDFVKAAFHLKVKLPMLGNMPVNKFLLAGFGILGLGHPGFWFLGLAYEGAYLMLLSGNARFQNLIRALRLEQNSAAMIERKDSFYRKLDRTSRMRFDRIVKLCEEILSATARRRSLIDAKEFTDLDRIQLIFLKLLCTQLRIRKILTEVTGADIEQEIAKTNQALQATAETSSVYRSLQSTLEIQLRRLENLKTAEDNLRITAAEIERIENQLKLLKEEALISSDADVLGIHLDSMMNSMQGTNLWMDENVDMFGPMDDEPLLASSMPPPLPKRTT